MFIGRFSGSDIRHNVDEREEISSKMVFLGRSEKKVFFRICYFFFDNFLNFKVLISPEEKKVSETKYFFPHLLRELRRNCKGQAEFISGKR